MFLIVAVATGLIIYTNMSMPQDVSHYISQTHGKHHEIHYNGDSKGLRILASFMKVYWTLVLVIYLAVSFSTGMWAWTWLIWVIASAIKEAIYIFFIDLEMFHQLLYTFRCHRYTKRKHTHSVHRAVYLTTHHVRAILFELQRLCRYWILQSSVRSDNRLKVLAAASVQELLCRSIFRIFQCRSCYRIAKQRTCLFVVRRVHRTG